MVPSPQGVRRLKMFRKAEPELRFKEGSQAAVVCTPIIRSDTLSAVLVFSFLRSSTFCFVAQGQGAACRRSMGIVCSSV